MTTGQFLSKLMSRYLWGNLLAMGIVAGLLCLGVAYGLDLYTHHGEAITIPNLRHRDEGTMRELLAQQGVQLEVTDTGYVKSLPPGCILEQTPAPGQLVKKGRVVYVTINAAHSPTIALPDVVDNSSLREAMAKLSAMGFRLGTPEWIAGEKDWVYGIKVNGRMVVAGQRIPVDAVLVIQVGNGMRDEMDSVSYIDPEPLDPYGEEETMEDPFQEVTAPPQQDNANNAGTGSE